MSASRLHPGAVAHYEDAVAYEQRYEARSEDVEYYMRRCRGKTVLEYGAGAGRVTLPLARAGSEVCAVDTSEPMLALLKRRLRGEDRRVRERVTARKGDMRTFSTRRRFDAVIAGFHTVCHLYSTADVGAFLRKVHLHLKAGGTFDCDLPLPRIDVPGYDPLAQVRVMEMEGRNGPELLTQRWYAPQEIAMHLHYAGFERIRLGAEYTSSKIQPETSVFVVAARKPF